MSNPSLDCTVCQLEGAAGTPSSYTPNLPQVDCSGIEQFRGGRRGGRGGGRGGRRGGRRGGWGRGFRRWRGGYRGFGYYPYWYGSHYYWPTYYDYPYVSRQPVLTGVVRPSALGGGITFVMALIAMVVAFLALKK